MFITFTTAYFPFLIKIFIRIASCLFHSHFVLFFTDFYSITISVKYNYHISKSVNLYNISAQSANNATNFSYILFKKFIIAKKNQGIGPLFPASGLQQDLIYQLAVQIFYLGKTYSANKASIERLKDETNLRNWCHSQTSAFKPLSEPLCCKCWQQQHRIKVWYIIQILSSITCFLAFEYSDFLQTHTNFWYILTMPNPIFNIILVVSMFLSFLFFLTNFHSTSGHNTK